MMEPVRTIIVDDEPIARRGILLELMADQEIVVIGECRNAAQAIAVIRKEMPDLIFLDIQMPKMDGFAVVEQLGLSDVPAVVFVTAYDEFALQAFDANAIDYVLKPIDPVRFHRAVHKAKLSIHRRRLALREPAQEAKRGFLNRVVVRSSGRIDFIPVETIDLVEAADNYVTLSIGTRTFLHRDTIKHLEQRLNPDMFVRIRRSTLVNIHSIKQLRRQSNGEFCVVLKSDRECMTSRRYRKNIQNLSVVRSEGKRIHPADPSSHRK